MAKVEKLVEHSRQMRKHPTLAEDLLWRRLRGRREDGLKFRRQEPIGPFIADFVCHEAKLVIEVDGLDHLQKLEADLERSAWLQKEGYEVLRLKNEDLLFQPRVAWIAVMRKAYSRVQRLADRVDEIPSW